MNARGAGRRVLVAEDEFVIALEVGEALRRAGFEVVGPAATAGEAERLAAEEPLEAAVLDLELRDGTAVAAADALAGRGVPFVFLSGYGVEALPGHLRGRAVLDKPFAVERLPAALGGDAGAAGAGAGARDLGAGGPAGGPGEATLGRGRGGTAGRGGSGPSARPRAVCTVVGQPLPLAGASEAASDRRSKTSALARSRNRPNTLFHCPNSGGGSRQGLPVLAIHGTASTNSRLPPPVRPGSPFLPRQCGSILARWASVSTNLSIYGPKHDRPRTGSPNLSRP